MKKLSDGSVADMPERVRLYRYHQEKNELLARFPMMSQTEKDELQRKLSDKWRI